MTDYTRPSTWRPFKSGLCQQCHGDCCRLPVEVHIEELVSMGLAHSQEVEHELRQLIKRLKKEGAIRLYDQKGHMCTLSQRPDDSCLFLEENRRCQIYAKRPQTCRNFPVVGPRPHYCPWNPQ
ncbi:MAG: YkgJ family cysteine cluster protein [Pseudomonadota bacterium]